MKTSHSGVLRSVGSPLSSGTAVFLACTACQISAGVYSERSRSCGVTCCKSSMFCSLCTFSKMVQ